MVDYLNFLSGNEKYVLFFLIILVILIAQKFVQHLINRVITRNQLPPDLMNGIRVIVRFGFAILMLYAAVIILEIGQNTTIGLSVFLGSVISFASMYTIQNFVAGIYLVATQPFKVNDFVKIGSSEGVVTEISLNYTTILNFEGILEYLPNKRILGSFIINYDQKAKRKSSQVEGLSWYDKVKDSLEEKEISRYTFVWGSPLIGLQEIKQRIDKICKKYKPIFGYLPEYMAATINHRFEFHFILQADEPITILKNKTKFLDDMSAQFH